MRDYVIDIIQRYVDDRIRKAGEAQISCRCPFHKGGQERRPSFSVNVDMGLYHCFTCHESGTIPTLLTRLGLPPEVVDRETAAIKDEIKDNLESLKIKRLKQRINNDPFRAPVILSETIIAAYNWCPTQLVQSGFQIPWLQYLQVGVDRKNWRITYPVRDIYGNLAGIVGGSALEGQLPKYRVYKGKRKDHLGNVIPSEYGEWFDEEYPGYVFQNHDYLWNIDRVYPRLFFGKEAETLYITEGFKAAIWLMQNGYRNTVALMGTSMSHRQEQLILRMSSRILLFLDNDSAGQEGTLNIGKKLQKAVPSVWVARYPSPTLKCQPDNLDKTGIDFAVGSATPLRKWKKERTVL
jgi:DNA primase